jgi:hypothetical protein
MPIFSCRKSISRFDSSGKTGKVKFSTQAATSFEIKYKLINGAIADSKAEKHADGAKII